MAHQAYGNEIYPAPNPAFLSSLERAETLIYSWYVE